MAIKFNTTEKAARQDTFSAAPADIKRGRNSRMIDAPDYPETVRALALSIIKSGQLQPAECRRDENNDLILTLGNTRYDAIDLIRKGFDAIDPDTGEKTHYCEPNAHLWIRVVDTTTDEAFIRGIKENLERKDTTDLQEALAQQELRTTQGMTDTQIARLYGYTNTNRVAALSKLLTLSDSIQNKVHHGKLALYSALDVLKLDPEERAAVLDGATNPRGNVEGAVLRKLIRDLQEKKADAGGTVTEGDEDGGEGGEGKAASIKRTVKEFKTFVKNATSEDDGEDFKPIVNEFLDALVNWFDGKKNFGDKKLKSLLAELR